MFPQILHSEQDDRTKHLMLVTNSRGHDWQVASIDAISAQKSFENNTELTQWLPAEPKLRLGIDDSLGLQGAFSLQVGYRSQGVLRFHRRIQATWRRRKTQISAGNAI